MIFIDFRILRRSKQMSADFKQIESPFLDWFWRAYDQTRAWELIVNGQGLLLPGLPPRPLVRSPGQDRATFLAKFQVEMGVEIFYRSAQDVVTHSGSIQVYRTPTSSMVQSEQRSPANFPTRITRAGSTFRTLNRTIYRFFASNSNSTLAARGKEDE